MITLKINGAEQQFDGDPDMPLLWYLRDIAGLTGSKFGCGAGLCGACTVHQDGVAIRSCITPVRNVVGKEITTIEGLSGNICRCGTYQRIRAAIKTAAKETA